MRLLMLGALAVGVFAAGDDKMHLRVGAVNLAAQTIEREDPGNSRSSRYASLIHLKGAVEIRACCVAAPGGAKGAPGRYVMVRADKADYNRETGEIQAEGGVRISFDSPGK